MNEENKNDNCFYACFMYDVTQETFLQVFKKYHTYDSSRPIEPWIYKITVNTARNTLRKQRWLSFTSQLPDSTDFDGIDNQILKNEEEMELWKAINQLSQKCREVVILHYYLDMKLHEVAYSLGIPLGTCKSRLHYALSTLKKQLVQHDYYI